MMTTSVLSEQLVDLVLLQPDGLDWVHCWRAQLHDIGGTIELNLVAQLDSCTVLQVRETHKAGAMF